VGTLRADGAGVLDVSYGLDWWRYVRIAWECVFVLTMYVEFELDGQHSDMEDRRKANLAIMLKVRHELLQLGRSDDTKARRWSSPSPSSTTCPAPSSKPLSHSNTCASSPSSDQSHILATFCSL
jgi:hypothetical protein